jgi:threonine aldolase
VRFRLTGGGAARFVDEAYRLGVHMLPSGADGVRAVFYLDISERDVDVALDVVAKTLRGSEVLRDLKVS